MNDKKDQKGWVTVRELFSSVKKLADKAEKDEKLKRMVKSAEKIWEQGYVRTA